MNYFRIILRSILWRFFLQKAGSLHVVLEQTGPSTVKRLNDLQINSTACGSMSEGICVDIDGQSLSNYSNSQHSLDDEGIDDPSVLINGKNDEITIKVRSFLSFY